MTMIQSAGYLRLLQDLRIHYVSIEILFAASRLSTHYHISSVIRQSFSLPEQSQNLDPSYKMDLDLWDCLGRVKLLL